MKAINKKNVAEVRNAVNDFNMGFLTRAQFAGLLASARAPYVGRVRNFVMYVADRIYMRANNIGAVSF